MHTACCTMHSKNTAEYFTIIEKIAAISRILQDFVVLLRIKKQVWQHTKLNNYIDQTKTFYLQNYDLIRKQLIIPYKQNWKNNLYWREFKWKRWYWTKCNILLQIYVTFVINVVFLKKTFQGFYAVHGPAIFYLFTEFSCL